jgi:predicted CoA-binding protein
MTAAAKHLERHLQDIRRAARLFQRTFCVNTDWKSHLLTTPAEIAALLERSKRVAVLGIKPDPEKAANFVPAFLKDAGYEIIPVPVYYPELTEILGERVYRSLAEIPGEIDIVDVFRRPASIPPHLDDIIASKPKAVWFQLGIRNDEAAEKLARAGIDVVQDRCMLVEVKRLANRTSPAS